MFAKQVVLTRPAKFTVQETLDDDKKKDAIAFAHDRLRLAIQSLSSNLYYEKIYQAVLLHIKDDFYIPAMEMLNNRL